MKRRSHRFIIADDDPELRFFVRRILLKMYPDATVDEAANGEEALELYERSGADLMVIDDQIPYISGTELIRKLRASNATIPLVMASNHPKAKEKAMNAGATFFLDKGLLDPTLGYYLPVLLPNN